MKLRKVPDVAPAPAHEVLLLPCLPFPAPAVQAMGSRPHLTLLFRPAWTLGKSFHLSVLPLTKGPGVWSCQGLKQAGAALGAQHSISLSPQCWGLVSEVASGLAEGKGSGAPAFCTSRREAAKNSILKRRYVNVIFYKFKIDTGDP